VNAAGNFKQAPHSGNRCIDLAECRQNERNEIAGALVFRREGRDDFLEARITAKRVPEG
jgi:hypothetical protein